MAQRSLSVYPSAPCLPTPGIAKAPAGLPSSPAIPTHVLRGLIALVIDDEADARDLLTAVFETCESACTPPRALPSVRNFTHGDPRLHRVGHRHAGNGRYASFASFEHWPTRPKPRFHRSRSPLSAPRGSPSGADGGLQRYLSKPMEPRRCSRPSPSYASGARPALMGVLRRPGRRRPLLSAG